MHFFLIRNENPAFLLCLNELQRKKLSSLQFIGYCHYQHLLSVTIRYLQDLQKENDIFSPNFIRKDKQEEFVHRVRNGISQNVSEQRGIKKKALRNGPKISVLV